MHTQEYLDYLRSDRWKQFRKTVLERQKVQNILFTNALATKPRAIALVCASLVMSWLIKPEKHKRHQDGIPGESTRGPKRQAGVWNNQKIILCGETMKKTIETEKNV